MKSPFDTLSWVVSSGDSTPPTPNPITGTGPVLASLMEGDVLSTKVTWGSYSSTAGSIINPTTKEMAIDGADWVTYNGALVPEVGESVRLRETPSDGTNTRRYTSSTQVVQADPTTVPDTFGVDDWTLVHGNTQATVTLLQLPDDGGRELLDIEYRLDGGSWISTGGLVGFTVTSLTNGTEYSVELRAVNSKGPGLASVAKEVTPATVPSAFTEGQWTVTPSNNQLSVSISALPSSGGSTITSIEYRLDGGSWTGSGRSTPGVFTISGVTNGSSYDVELRAVNAVGSSAASDVKNIALPTTPSAFTSGDWTLTPGNELLTVIVLTLPSNGGTAITDIQYQVDSGSWTTSGLSTTGTFDITGLSNSTSYDVKLRAVNVLGVGGVSDTKSATPANTIARTPWTATTRSMHSGHSLTDAYYGSPQGDNEGYLTLIRDSLLDPDTGASGAYMFKNTFGGSSMEDRWDGDSLAKTNIENYDALMITESGPPPQLSKTVNRTFSAINTRWDRWLKFAANTVENGAGNEVLLWSIWPYIDIETLGGWDGDDWLGVTFDDALVEYGKIYETMAAYASWKMRDLYPALPEDWRVWVVPGHRFWRRVNNDLGTSSVPTITTLNQLFSDNIHPDSRAQYGLACLAYSILYQVDLREQTGVFVPAGLDSGLRDYFWTIAWEIATAYEPAGLGGVEAEGSLWVEGVDTDFMPDWTLAVSDVAPGWSAIVPAGITNISRPTFTGSLVEFTEQSMTAGTWSTTPAQVQYVWRLDWSEIISEVSTCTPAFGTYGQELSSWSRARLAGGPWTDWENVEGGGIIQRNYRPGLVGVNFTTGTTTAIPAHQVGDVIIITAYRATNNTIPTRPVGWNGITGGGGNAFASTWGYKIATSSSELSGTWTNSSGLIARVYRNALGVTSESSANSNATSVNLPALTLVGEAEETTIDRIALGGGTPDTLSTPSNHTSHLSSTSSISIGLWTTTGENYAVTTTSNATSAAKRAHSIGLVGVRVCSMTTGTYDAGGGSILTGYSQGTGIPAFGTLDKQPIPGQTFLGIFHNAANNQVGIAFAGNLVAGLNGKSAYLGTHEYKGTWTYSASGNPFGVPVTWMVLNDQDAIAQPVSTTFEIKAATP